MSLVPRNFENQLLWATDVHLDHLGHPAAALEFGRALSGEHPTSSGLLLTGDIGEAPSVCKILRDLKTGFGKPVYFVLGNHDYYGGSFAEVDSMVTTTCARTPGLVWVRETAVKLHTNLSVLGNSGWYDARFGNRNTDLRLTDFVRIADLFAAQDDGHEALLEACERRADSLALYLRQQIRGALESLLPPEPSEVSLGEPSANAHQSRAGSTPSANLLVLTHVPPFEEACTYQGRQSDGNWSPFFASRSTGETLLEFADAHPDVQLTVLCGHTHDRTAYQPRANLSVHCGAAQYGAPELAGVVSFEDGRVRVEPRAPG